MAEDDQWKAEIRDSFKNISVDYIDGVAYQQWVSPVRPIAMYDMMKNTKIRKSDIITTGFPRSGNHWAYDVVHMVMHQKAEFAEVAFVDAFWDFRDQKGFDALEAMPAPRHLVTHTRPRRYPKDTLEVGPKMIFVLRNPKDVIKSMFEVCSKFDDLEMKYTGTWNQFFELFMMGEFTWGSWFEHTWSLEKVLNEHPEIPVHIHQYEKMVENPVDTIKELCRFLGKDEDIAESIAETTFFDNMKTKHTKMEKVDEHFFGKDKKGSLLGMGKIGNWRNVFTVAQSERFNEIFEEKMAGSKLAALVRDYL